MTKIMLVEDDKSLREIYSIRLTAEGYEVVSAGDGEEALALAVKERPDLVLSDVMMPKISGFDMLDILRSTPETKDTKVIMMTALSSDDQRVRGENLGADKYLVKSQVGIEDVINSVHEVIGDKATPEAAPEAVPEVAAVEAVPVVAPEAPVAPMGAVAPEVVAAPETPAAPAMPIAPEAPAEPVAPKVPAAPEAPAEPIAAEAPVAPVAPEGSIGQQMEALLNAPEEPPKNPFAALGNPDAGAA